MLKCKKCNSNNITKSGKVNGKQRYFCKSCRCHFTEGDGRTNERVAVKKAMCVVLHSLSKVSYRKQARLFSTSPSLTYRWIVESGCKQPDQEAIGEIKQLAFDKMQNYIKSKEANFDTSRPVTIASGELWAGYPAIVILQNVDDSAKK